MSRREDPARYDGSVGEWWIAGDPESKFPGVLTRDRKRGWWTLKTLRKAGTPPELPHGVVTSGGIVYGETSAGPASLLHANVASYATRSEFEKEAWVEYHSDEWHAFEVVLGGHHDATTRWNSIGVELPLAWDWMSPTVLEPRDKRVLHRELNESLECRYGDLEIALWRSATWSGSKSGEHLVGRAAYVFECVGGLSTDTIDQPLVAIRNLHEVLFGARVRADTLRLSGPFGADPPGSFAEVSGARRVAPRLSLPDPYLSTGDIDFGDFLPRWIRLHVDSPSWPVFGRPNGSTGWVHTDVLEAISALESLAREHDEMSNPHESEHLLIRGATAHLPRAAKSRVEHLLRFDGPALADRLESVANLIGPASARWLLGEDLRAWANVVARLRNLISHGGRSRSGAEHEPQVVVAVLLAVRVVYQLAMLRLAGFTNRQDGEATELLVDGAGHSVIGHPNSALAHKFADVRASRDAWKVWADGLRPM